MKAEPISYIAPPITLTAPLEMTPMSLPTGLTWRSEFAPQHADGKEKPSASAPKATVPGEQDTTGSAGAPTPGGQGDVPPPCGDSTMLYMMGAMFLVLYFFMIRPGQKQEKALKEMRSSLQKDDRIVTTSGMHGIILSVNEQAQTITLKTDEEGRVRMTFDQSAISRKISDDTEATNS